VEGPPTAVHLHSNSQSRGGNIWRTANLGLLTEQFRFGDHVFPADLAGYAGGGITAWICRVNVSFCGEHMMRIDGVWAHGSSSARAPSFILMIPAERVTDTPCNWPACWLLGNKPHGKRDLELIGMLKWSQHEKKIQIVRFCCLPPASSTPPPLLRHTLLFACLCYGLISLSRSGQPAGLCCFCHFWVSGVCARTVCPCAPREGLGWEAWTLSWFDGSNRLHTGIGHLLMVEGCGLVWAWGPDLEGFLPLHACSSMMSLSGSVVYIAGSGGFLHEVA
jgi:hypothetical protein